MVYVGTNVGALASFDIDAFQMETEWFRSAKAQRITPSGSGNPRAHARAHARTRIEWAIANQIELH